MTTQLQTVFFHLAPDTLLSLSQLKHQRGITLDTPSSTICHGEPPIFNGTYETHYWREEKTIAYVRIHVRFLSGVPLLAVVASRHQETWTFSICHYVKTLALPITGTEQQSSSVLYGFPMFFDLEVMKCIHVFYRLELTTRPPTLSCPDHQRRLVSGETL